MLGGHLMLPERDERFLRRAPWYLAAVALVIVGVAIYSVDAEGILFALALFSFGLMMGYSSLAAFAMRDVILRGVAEREDGKPASDRDEASASRGLDSDRVLRFAPFMNATTALILLAVAFTSATEDGGAGLAAFCFFSAAFFILLTFLFYRRASRVASGR
jgi:hypothetical protein